MVELEDQGKREEEEKWKVGQEAAEERNSFNVEGLVPHITVHSTVYLYSG